MTERDLDRAAVRAQIAVLLIAVGTVVHALVVGQWWWFACSIVVVIASRMPVVISIAAAVLSGVVGAWPALVAAILTLGIEVFLRVRLHLGFPVSPLDERALADAVRGLPESLTRHLPVDSPTVVDTAAVLRAAVADDPSRWPRALNPPALNSEGGVVAGTRWTVVAAEAALIAAERPDTGAPLDVHAVAGIAATIPHSLAGAMVPSEDRMRVLTALGLGVAELSKMTGRACRKPGGELVAHRLELATRGVPVPGSLLDDAEWRRLVRRPATEEA